MEHWVAGWGREGHASDHVAVFDDEQRARDWQGWWLVKIAERAFADPEVEQAARDALAEIHDGYGATGDVDGKTHWVSACETEGCPFPDAACVDARAANDHRFLRQLRRRCERGLGHVRKPRACLRR